MIKFKQASLSTHLRHSAMVFLTACVVIITGCGGSASADASNGSSSAQSESQSLQPMSEDEIKDWLTGETGYTGREATIVGRVFNSERDDGVSVFQINTDFENYGGNTVVFYKGENLKIDIDDYIKVTGEVTDPLDYENRFGAQMSATCIEASSVEELSYKDAVAPTKSSASPHSVNEQNGYKVTIDTIEFSDRETRIYVTIENNGAGRFSLYDYNAVIIQDGKQYNTEYNYQANYPSINNEVAIGATISGIITFPPIEVSDFELRMQGSSDNFEVDHGPFDFNFNYALG